MRLDLFLKTSRLVRRRAVAKELCEEGRVLVGGREAQPAKEVRPGDRLVLRFPSREIEIEVLVLPVRRGALPKEELYRVLAEKRVPREDDTW